MRESGTNAAQRRRRWFGGALAALACCLTAQIDEVHSALVAVTRKATIGAPVERVISNSVILEFAPSLPPGDGPRPGFDRKEIAAPPKKKKIGQMLLFEPRLPTVEAIAASSLKGHLPSPRIPDAPPRPEGIIQAFLPGEQELPFAPIQTKLSVAFARPKVVRTSLPIFGGVIGLDGYVFPEVTPARFLAPQLLGPREPLVRFEPPIVWEP